MSAISLGMTHAHNMNISLDGTVYQGVLSGGPGDPEYAEEDGWTGSKFAHFNDRALVKQDQVLSVDFPTPTYADAQKLCQMFYDVAGSAGGGILAGYTGRGVGTAPQDTTIPIIIDYGDYATQYGTCICNTFTVAIAESVPVALKMEFLSLGAAEVGTFAGTRIYNTPMLYAGGTVSIGGNTYTPRSFEMEVSHNFESSWANSIDRNVSSPDKFTCSGNMVHDINSDIFDNLIALLNDATNTEATLVKITDGTVGFGLGMPNLSFTSGQPEATAEGVWNPTFNFMAFNGTLDTDFVAQAYYK